MDMLVVMVAILKAGACYVPLDPKQPQERLSFILKNSNAAACITTSTVSQVVQFNSGLIILYDNTSHVYVPRPEISTCSTANLDSKVSNKQLAYVIYTSGTTGKPKGVLIEHQSVVNYCHWFADYSQVKAQDRIDWSSNPMFDMAVTSTIIPLMLGLTVVICREETQRYYKQYLSYLNDNHVNIIKITPSFFKELVREIKNTFIELPSLSLIVLGGEQLSSIDCSHWLSYYPNHTLINEYGPTEATVAFSYYPIDKSTPLLPDSHVSIGKPGCNMYYYILDQNNQIVLDDEEGELCIGGMGLARGYLNAPKLTRSRFIQDPFNDAMRLYKTGDLCRQLPSGLIEYLGRIDRQIKIRGFRIELDEVEHCLHQHSAIQDAVVFVHEHARQGTQLVAYYILKDKQDVITYSQLRDYILKSLPHYMVPVAMICVDFFPLLASGKLDQSLLPADGSRAEDVKKAHTKLERIIVKIWAKELGFSCIGVDDHFLELGGHSLIAARIISKLNQLLDVDIKYEQFYQAMTIKKLAKVVSSMAKNKPGNDIKNHKKFFNIRPLSDFQTILWACKTFSPKASKLNIVSRKRILGYVDINPLRLAFDAVLKKHKILSYRVSEFLPLQFVENAKSSTIVEKNLMSVPDEDLELVLWNSMTELMQLSLWPADCALVRMRLFYITSDVVELQMCMPHIISDGISIEILFEQLSELYLHYQRDSSYKDMSEAIDFIDYISQEQIHNKVRVNKDFLFWSESLNDAHLFVFPKQSIIDPVIQDTFSYSTYVPVSNKIIHDMRVFCSHQKVNLSEALSAVIGLSLMNCCDEKENNSKQIMMNIVKSTRDELAFNETIGCFIKIEPIKLFFSKTQTLLLLLNQIQEFTTRSAEFNQCSSMLKLASINKFYRKKKNALYYLIQGFIFIYRKMLGVMNVNHESLKFCPSLSLLDEKKHFNIYLNIWNNFVDSSQHKLNLFGLKSVRVGMNQHDLLTVDYVFEVCFMRDENNNKAYVVISSNIESALRERIANEIVRIMTDELN